MGKRPTTPPEGGTSIIWQLPPKLIAHYWLLTLVSLTHACESGGAKGSYSPGGGACTGK